MFFFVTYIFLNYSINLFFRLDCLVVITVLIEVVR
jgi:hypothetical protein